MTTVTIDNRSYPCPSAWNEIGWEQFFTLAEYAGQMSALLQRNGKRSGYWSAFAEWIREPFGRSTAGSENSSPTAWANVFSGFRRHFRRIRTETTVRTVSIGTEYGCCFPLRQSIPTAASYR